MSVLTRKQAMQDFAEAVFRSEVLDRTLTLPGSLQVQDRLVRAYYAQGQARSSAYEKLQPFILAAAEEELRQLIGITAPSGDRYQRVESPCAIRLQVWADNKWNPCSSWPEQDHDFVLNILRGS